MLQRIWRVIRRIVFGIILGLVAIIFITVYSDSHTPTTSGPTSAPTGIIPPPAERMSPEEFAKAQARDQELRQNELQARREKAVSDYMEEIQLSLEQLDMLKSTPMSAWLVIVSLFDESAKLYNNGTALGLTPEQEAIRVNFGTQLSQKQSAIYPKLREAFAEELGKRLWRQDYKVTAYNCQNNHRRQCLSVTGFRLSANSSKQDMHQSLAEQLAQLRFTGAYYKAYSGDNDEYGWTLANIPADGDIAYLQNGRYVMVLQTPQRQRPNR